MTLTQVTRLGPNHLSPPRLSHRPPTLYITLDSKPQAGREGIAIATGPAQCLGHQGEVTERAHHGHPQCPQPGSDFLTRGPWSAVQSHAQAQSKGSAYTHCTHRQWTAAGVATQFHLRPGQSPWSPTTDNPQTHWVAKPRSTQADTGCRAPNSLDQASPTSPPCMATSTRTGGLVWG